MTKVPDKIRMPIARILAFGSIIAESAGLLFKNVPAPIMLSAVYKQGSEYRRGRAAGLDPDESIQS